MPTTNLGKVTIVSKGAYSTSVTYEKLDVVTYNGSSYIALKTTKGNAPTNTNYWSILAQKGDKGDQGIQGIKGDTGEGVPEGGDSGQIVVRNLNGNTWEKSAFVKPDLTEEYYKNVTDSADFPFTDFQVTGNTYQAQGTGKNLYDFKTIFEHKFNQKEIKEVQPNIYDTTCASIYWKQSDFKFVKFFSESDLNKPYTVSCDVTILKIYTTYVNLSLNFGEYNESENSMSSIKSHSISTTDVSPAALNTKYKMKIENFIPTKTNQGVYFSYGSSGNILIENIQLEQSKTVTEFEPYTNLLPAPTPDNPMPIINAGTLNSSGKYEVHMSLSDGTNTQDVTLTSDVELTKWDRLERRDGVWGWSIRGLKITISGNENWIKRDDVISDHCFYFRAISDNELVKNNAFCSHFERGSRIHQDNNIQNKFSDDISTINVLFSLSNGMTTVEQCKNFFQNKYITGNPVMLYVRVANEVSFSPLPEEEQTLLNNLRTYYPQTIFAVEDYATVTGKYVADAKTYIDNKVSELEALVASAYTMGVNSIE